MSGKKFLQSDITIMEGKVSLLICKNASFSCHFILNSVLLPGQYPIGMTAPLLRSADWSVEGLFVYFETEVFAFGVAGEKPKIKGIWPISCIRSVSRCLRVQTANVKKSCMKTFVTLDRAV